MIIITTFGFHTSEQPCIEILNYLQRQSIHTWHIYVPSGFDIPIQSTARFQIIYISNITDIKRPIANLMDDTTNCPLPLHRNHDKDTREFIQTRYYKYDFINHSLTILSPSATSFAWIDVDTLYAGKTPERICMMTDWLHHYSPFKKNDLYLPGAWLPFQNEDKDVQYALENVHWRFCGGIIIGSPAVFQQLYTLLQQSISQFFAAPRTDVDQTGTLIWDINMLAWTEWKYPNAWPAIWYSAQHGESIYTLPPKTTAMSLKDVPGTRIKDMQLEWPRIPNYYASTASTAETPLGTVVNIRYVNYWMFPNGAYKFNSPDRIIHSKNYAILRRPDGAEYGCWMEEQLGLDSLPDHSPISRGLEDIRLYYHTRTNTLLFSATTVEYNRTPKIMVGEYALNWNEETGLSGKCIHGRVIASPDGASNITRWEKNWTPLLFQSETDDMEMYPHYIYQWSPLSIGSISPENALHIKKEYTQTCALPLMKHIRGSSPFVWNKYDGTNIGVVHYSINDTSPRHYYHMLIQLYPTTNIPIGASQPFTFSGEPIEFCTSMSVTENENEPVYQFYVSRFDRDPISITVPANAFSFVLFK